MSEPPQTEPYRPPAATEPPPTEPYIPLPAVAPTERIADCRLVREIGRGGMGVVYEAVQEPLGRPVAVKVLPAAGASARDRFRREAQAAARLHHTNIVPVYAHGEDAGRCYYVMQLIRGVGLEAVLAARAAGVTTVPLAGLPPADYYRAIAGAGVQVADALHYAHALGVLHRDIKPSNLLRDESGRVWVTDFGVAKLIDDDHRTRTGELIGTLNYLPPERLAGQSDARGDVYSLGVTLYELLTARSAFPESTPELLIRQLPAGLPERPRDIRPDIPADLETIILKAAAADPAWRYQSAGELADDLRRLLDDRPVQARRTGLPERAWLWAKREPRLAAATGTTILLLAASTVFATFGYYGKRHGERLQANLRQQLELSLTRETELRKQDQETAQVALDGLNKTLEYLTPTRLTVGLTPEGVPVVKDLLKTYTDIAAKCEGHPELADRAAEARRRIGDLSHRLGRYAEAVEAYSAALKHEEADPTDAARVVRAARLHNDLGQVHRALQQFDAERADHLEAVRLLTAGGDPASEAGRYELALAHFGLGRRNFFRDPPPTRPSLFPQISPRLFREEPPEQVEHRRQALALVRPLANAHLSNIDYWHLVALCMDQPAGGDDPVEILKKLVAAHKQVPELTLDLCEALARPGKSGPPSDERIQEAVDQLRRLYHDYPSVPAYQYSFGRCLDWRGIGRQVAGKQADDRGDSRQAAAEYAAARTHHEAAVNVLQPLADAHREVDEYRLGLGYARASVARAVLRSPPDRTDWADLDRRYRQAVADVEPLLAKNAQLDGVRPFLNLTYQEWAEVHTKLGNTAVAQEFTQKAERFADPAAK